MSKQHYSYNAVGLKCNVTSFQQILDEIGPNESLSSDVEKELSCLVKTFIQSVVKESCKLARHRNASQLEPKDVALFLKTQCNMDPSMISDCYYYAERSEERESTPSTQKVKRLKIDDKDVTQNKKRSQ